MKHYLTYIEAAIKKHWSRPAITNYGANSYTYGELAAGIEKMHILFNKYDIKKGDHIAICARNSAEWCIAFYGITTYGAVAVPLLADFLPQNIADLTKISGSRLLFVDKTILGNLTRDNIISQFADYEDLQGVIDIVKCETIDSCGGDVKVAQEELDAAFNARFPQGFTVADVKFEVGDLDDLNLISYTSGTSSSPKGVMLPAKSLWCRSSETFFSANPFCDRFSMLNSKKCILSVFCQISAPGAKICR